MKEVSYLTHVGLSLMTCAILAGCGSDQKDEVPTVSMVSSVSVKEKRLVTVAATATDDKEISGYRWEQLSGPTLTLTGVAASEVQVTAPEVDENSVAVLRVTVTDSANQQAQADVTVNIAKNQLPDLAANFSSVEEKSTASFQATATDADGEITSYQWTQLSGPQVTLSGANTSSVSFEVPAVSSATTLRFSVSVMDDDNEGSTLISDVVIDQLKTAYSLTGKVTEAAFANSSVSATVAEETFSTTADASGNFTLLVEVDDDATNFLTLLKASSTQIAGLELYKFLPDFTANAVPAESASPQSGLLTQKRQSRSDKALATENNGISINTSINPVSTAHYALLLAENNNVMPIDRSTYDAVEKLIDPDLLIEAAALVYILSQQDALPEGVTDVVSLLNKPELYNAYKEAVETENPDAITQAIATLVADPDVVEPQDETSLVGKYVTYMPAQSGFLSRFGEKLMFNEDGTGARYTTGSHYSFDWSISEQAIELDYTNTSPFTYYTNLKTSFVGLTAEQMKLLTDAGITTIQVTQITTGAQMWRTVKGNTMDVYRFSEKIQRTLPPIDLGNGVVISTDGETEIINTDYFVRNIETQMPLQFTAEEIPGQWVLRSFDDNENPDFLFSSLFAETFNFAPNGTGTTKETARSFDWELNAAGHLLVTFASKTRLEFRKLDQLDDKSSALISVYDAEGNLIAADTDYSLKLDGSDFSQYDHINQEGSYWNSMINLWNKYYWQDNRILWEGGFSYFGFMFKNNNTGYQMYQHTGTPPEMVPNLGPQMTWIEIPDESGVSMIQVNRRACNDNTAYSCNIRNYRLLKSESGILGRRIYVLEESYYRNRSTDPMEVLIPPRLNMYEELSVNYWNETAPAQTSMSLFTKSIPAKTTVEKKLREPNKPRLPHFNN
jgi:hypothetical protein